jgi:hypothetical protein
VFLVTGFFLLALLFGQQIFSDKPTAPLYGSAFSTVLVLIGTGTSAFGDQADAKFFERIALLLVGVSYLILALSVLQSINVRERWMGFGRWVGARLAAIAHRLPV